MQFFYRLRELPVLRVFIPFCLGIIAGFYYSFTSPYSLIIIASLILILGISIRFFRSDSLRGFIVLSMFFLCGLWLIQNKLSIRDSDLSMAKEIRATVVSFPVKKAKYTKFIVRTEYRNKLPKRLLVYIFTKDSLPLVKGDVIELRGKLKAIENRKKSDFDFKHYMKRQYVSYSCFVSENDYYIAERDNISFIRFCSMLRNRFSYYLGKTGIREPELGLLNAMLLGIKNNIDGEIKQNYISAGVIHILAISGLHTGIVFLLISFLLTTVFRLKKTGIIFFIICTALIWMYAIVTGLAPSVLRATILLTFLLIGKCFNRQLAIYNAIAGSAIFILLFDPGALFSPGFQLSYAAYTSIIYLYPKLYSLFKINNPILDAIWKVAAVSMAAQIGTLPLGIFYFHHIYYYSILTNLCISVFIPIIIYGGFAAILIAIVLPSWSILAEGLTFVLRFVDRIIEIIAQLPGAASGHIDLGILQAIAMYGIIGGLFAMLWYKKRQIIFIILISVFLLVSYESYMKISKGTGLEQKMQY